MEYISDYKGNGDIRLKDKVKGLIIGITIGSMLTGVSAYAAGGTKIKGFLQKVNIYVD
ncbi:MULTISPECIES: hypothetical protein [Paenibacillus]|uniref:hypothetical protein n=1 Tax=Paenibacillus TaxID=44249 RepID=UPI0015C42E1A|nr:MULTISPECIES: hypothetical protein [Paenibacillus]